MAQQYFYTSNAVQTTLAAALGSVAAPSTGQTIQVASTAGWPTQFPAPMLLEWGTVNQERVTLTQAATGSGPFTYANCIRGDDGTAAPAHGPSAAVYHGVTASDYFQTAPVFNVCAYGADPTGTSTTSNVGIQAALTACSAAGGGTVTLPPGLFIISTTLLISSNTNLVGAGTGVTIIRAKSGSWAAVVQQGAYSGVGMLQIPGEATVSNITVRGITWDGNETGITALPPWVATVYTNSPLMLWNVTGLTIENCQVINSVGYGIYSASLTNFHIDRNTVTTGQVTAAQSWGTPIQQDGIHLTSVIYGTVSGNTIDTGTSQLTGDDGIAIQSFGVCHDIAITGNSIRSAQAAVDLAISGADIYDVSITGNNVWTTQANGIVSQPFIAGTAISRNISITGNNITSPCSTVTGTNGISLLDYSIISTPATAYANITIAGNTIENITSTSAAGIYCGYGNTVTVAGNTIRAFQGYSGVQVGNNVSATSIPASNFTVSGNVIDVSSNTTGGCSGIAVKDSKTGAISSNVILGPGAATGSGGNVGVNTGSFGATVQGVTVSGNTMTGWTTGVQEYNAGGTPDFNSYTGNIFQSTTTAYSLTGPHDLILDSFAAGGIADVEQFVALTAAYTLNSVNTPQQLFNATTNGALTVAASTSFFFECEFDLTNLSASSGTFSFGFGGTATFTSVKYWASAQKTAAAGTLATWPSFVVTSATATALVAASVTTTGAARLRGIIRINAAGTIIPQITLSTANAAVVSAGSWFRLVPVGSNTIAFLGNWS